MSTMTLEGYTARITYDSELDQFRGEIVGLNGGADFYGKTPTELRREFRKSLKVYLEVCEEKGINPHRQFSGKFNLRISPELHQRLATLADASGESLNTLVEEALTKVFQCDATHTGPASDSIVTRTGVVRMGRNWSLINAVIDRIADDATRQDTFTRPALVKPASQRVVRSKKKPPAPSPATAKQHREKHLEANNNP